MLYKLCVIFPTYFFSTFALRTRAERLISFTPIWFGVWGSMCAVQPKRQPETSSRCCESYNRLCLCSARPRLHSQLTKQLQQVIGFASAVRQLNEMNKNVIAVWALSSCVQNNIACFEKSKTVCSAECVLLRRRKKADLKRRCAVREWREWVNVEPLATKAEHKTEQQNYRICRPPQEYKT